MRVADEYNQCKAQMRMNCILLTCLEFLPVNYEVYTVAWRVTSRIRSFTRVILMLRWMGLGST